MPELARPSSVHLLPKTSHNLLLPAGKSGRDPLLLHFTHSQETKNIQQKWHNKHSECNGQEVLSGQLPQRAAAHGRAQGDSLPWQRVPWGGARADLSHTAWSLPLCDRQGMCILPVTSAHAWTPSCHFWHNLIETADPAREVFMTCSLPRVWTPGREKALDSITNPLSCPVSLITFNSHLLQII